MKLQYLFTILFFPLLLLVGCTNSPDYQSVAENPAGSHSQYPYLFSSGEELYMSWISDDKSGANTLQYARFADGSWSEPQTIAADSTWFVNWADFPSIIASNNGPIAAHWLNKKPGGPYAYDVNISFADNNPQWSPAFTPHFDSTATEHGFASMIPWDDNTILAVWLDGRRTADRADDEYYDINYAMTLRGALISTDGKIESSFLIDDAVCDCCQTSLVKTGEGAIVAYRDRTNDEIRDIYVSKFDGQQWTEPTSVHNDGWEIGACPVNGPKLAANDSAILLAWYTAADNTPVTKAAISTDGGSQFGPPITLNNQKSLGRVDAALNGETAYVSWMEKAGEKANLQLASFGITDTAVTASNIGQLNSSRKTGFPQMAVLKGKLIFAWTDVDSTETYIKTKSTD